MDKKIIIVLFLSVLILSVSFQTLSYSDSQDEQRVLMISSYSPSFMTFFHQIEGVKSQLASPNIVLDIEFMDSKRFFTDENLSNFEKSLTYKMQQVKYDLIIVSDDNALNFVMERQTLLFEETPIVFLGINNLANAEKAGNNTYITGVVEASSLDKTIEIALDFNPNAKRIVALVDPTTSGQGDLKRFYNLQSSFPDYEFKAIDLTNLSYDEFANELRKLNNYDIAILLSVYSDKNNNRVNFWEGLEMIVRNINQPIYHPYMHGIGEGVLGGKVISHYEQGKTAGELAIRVLNGEPISEINYIKKSPNQYVFDNNVMEKYNISRSQLPKDTLLLNYEEPFFIKYKFYVLIASIIIIFEGFIIGFLVKLLKLNKKYQFELKESHDKLALSNESIKKLNETLENRVRERTELLESTNEELMIALDNLRNTQDRLLKNRAMESFLSLSRKLAHLINTPLGSALTSITYQRDSLTDLEHHKSLFDSDEELLMKLKDTNEMMHGNILRAIKVVNELQAFTIFEPSQKVNLSQSIEHFFNLLTLNPKYNELNIELNLDQSIELTLQEGMLHRILKSLVENSMDFANTDSLIVKINLKDEKDMYVLSIIDNGVGIKTENRSDIFKAFYSSNPHKLGMGLFLAESTVFQALNGSLTLDVTYEKGAKFDIMLNKETEDLY